MCAGCTCSSPSAQPDDEPPGRPDAEIGVVGVCGAGKSTLVAALRRAGYRAHQISQEHSHVHDLWRRFAPLDILVCLEASDAAVEGRIGPLSYSRLLERQRQRLAHAHANCDIRVDTDRLTAEQVAEAVLQQLARLGVSPPASGDRAAEEPPPPRG